MLFGHRVFDGDWVMLGIVIFCASWFVLSFWAMVSQAREDVIKRPYVGNATFAIVYDGVWGDPAEASDIRGTGR